MCPTHSCIPPLYLHHTSFKELQNMPFPPLYPALIVTVGLASAFWYLYKRTFLLPVRRRALANRHVWIVGASRGLGRATALHFASHRAIVSISARSQSALTSLAHQLRPQLGAVVPFDVTAPFHDFADALASVEKIAPVDILVANAGINHSALPFESLTAEKIDSLIDTNFRAVARLFAVLLPRLTPNGGTLCAISSLAAYRGLPGATIYAATKSAVSTMCQALAVELYASNVNVVCVHPGFVDTSAIKHLHHPKPFLIDEHAAAKEVVNAVAMGSSHHAFPWPMEHVVMRISRYLPTPLYNLILHHTS